MNLRTACIFLVALCTFNSCTPTNGYPPPTDQRIGGIEWSPDGQKLAFKYQGFAYNYDVNNRPDDFLTFIVYKIQADGTQLKKVLEDDGKEHSYSLLQWASDDKLLIGDGFDVYEVNASGEMRLLFDAKAKSLSNARFGTDASCSWSDGRYVLVNGMGVKNQPILIDTRESQPGNYRPLELVPPHPFTGSQPYPWISCASFSRSVVLFSRSYDIKTQTESNLFATAEVVPESAKVQNIRTFDPLKFRPEQEKIPEYRVLGWKNEHTLVYAFAFGMTSTPLAVYEYDVTTGETRQNQDIKVLGEFSPDFQKVAYITYFDKSDYLTVSRPDGTDMRRILKVESLPTGALP